MAKWIERFSLKGKTALVTGGSEGIGKGIARALSKEGVDVAICARRKEPLEAAANEIAKETGRNRVVRFDSDAFNAHTTPEDGRDQPSTGSDVRSSRPATRVAPIGDTGVRWER